MRSHDSALEYRDHYEQAVAKAAAYIRERLGERKPVFGIVLGSGLGGLADEIAQPTILSYEEIPGFPKTTVAGHEGKLLIGELEGVSVIGLKGRKHYYEVADAPMNIGILQVVFAVHVLAELGVTHYFVTNAAGGLNPSYKVGDLMILRSHLSFLPNSLLGRHHTFTRVDTGERVARFEPMNDAYDSELRTVLKVAASDQKGHIHEGVYLALTGPTYETEAECIMFRDSLHADAVGMSTVPEVIAARSRGMRVVGMSCITNTIAPDGTNATNHEEVKAILESRAVKERLVSTVKNFFRAFRERDE